MSPIRSYIDFFSCKDNTSGMCIDCVIGSNVNHNFPTHIHDSICIGLITKGKRYLTLSGNTEVFREGEMFVINKNEPHSIRQDYPHDYIAITAKGMDSDINLNNRIDSNLCRALFLNVFLSIGENNIDKIIDSWNQLYQHLIENEKSDEILSDNMGILIKSLSYIQNHYQEPIKVDDIAQSGAVSKFHFSRLFKDLTGLSPHNYLIQYRLRKSYNQLKSDSSVFDVAVNSGFYDSSHFIKLFYEHMAVSPKEYQDSIKKNSTFIQQD